MRSIAEFHAEVGRVSAPAFAGQYPKPFLLLAIAELSSSSQSIDATIRAQRPDRGAADRPNYAAQLVKTDRNYFQDMVIVGRSPMADICIPLPTVSKIHAFFTPGAEAWTITHHGSTNGVVVNGKRIEGGEAIVLRDGDRLGLGPSVNAWFYSAAALYPILRSL